MFEGAIKSKATRVIYTYYFKRFCNETGLTPEQIVELGKKKPEDLTQHIVQLIIRYKDKVEKGSLSFSSISNFYKAVKHFCVMSDIILNWPKMNKMLPEAGTGQDRAISADEIRQLLKAADHRGKALVLLLASSGVRIGAIPYIKLKHLKESKDKGKVIAASLVVYPESKKDRYSTFITPECFEAVQDYIRDRKKHREVITDNSPIFRNRYGRKATKCKTLEYNGARSVINRLLHESNVRGKEKEGKRFPFQADHGFRKFFMTRCQQIMKPINVEILMGHSVGVSGRYYKPSEKELLEDYLKAVPYLTFSKEPEQDASRIEALESQVKALQNLVSIKSAIANYQPIRGKNDELIGLVDPSTGNIFELGNFAVPVGQHDTQSKNADAKRKAKK